MRRAAPLLDFDQRSRFANAHQADQTAPSVPKIAKYDSVSKMVYKFKKMCRDEVLLYKGAFDDVNACPARVRATSLEI